MALILCGYFILSLKKGKIVICQRIYGVRRVRCKRSVERRHSLAKSAACILYSLPCFIHHWTSSSSVAKPVYGTELAQNRTINFGVHKDSKTGNVRTV